MDPATLVTIIGWFAQPAAQALFTSAQAYVQQRLGLSSSPSLAAQVEPLLGKYLQILVARLDEDRIAKLYGAFSKLVDAPKSKAKQSLLGSALDGFHDVARIPERGITGGRPNAELRCMAFVGMVAAYTLLQDRAELIEEKMIEAVAADAETARRWLGDKLVRQISAQLPASTITCPKCGAHNPAGSLFCNRDGYPLDQGLSLQQPSLQPSFPRAFIRLIRQPGPAWIRAVQIFVDYNKIGVIRQNENCRFEVEVGSHHIYVQLDSYISPDLTFHAVPDEEVVFFCKTGWTKLSLWRP